MAKPRNMTTKELYDQNIENIDIASSTEFAMKIYGSNINILRQVPNIIDGLKSVERRVLYTMYEIIKCNYNKPFNKVSNIIGRTMSEFHPHGDKSIEDSLVKMSQPWAKMIPLVDGQGNFGSPSGERAGAARYIEARLSYYAYKCFFEDLDIGAIEVTDNYLMTRKEPIWLPAKYPNVLINNVFGIGYGLSTGIPSYNFQEVCELAIKMLKGDKLDPNVDYLVPEIPSGAMVVDSGQFPDICSLGSGSFKNRATLELDRDKNIITIVNLPIRVKMESVIDSINKEIDVNRLHGLKDIREYSDNNTIRMEFHFKQEVDLDAMVDQLRKISGLESTVSVKFNLIEDYVPGEYNLYTILEAWIEARKEIKIRTINRKLVRLYERLHILDVLLFILNDDNAEKTLALVKRSNSKDDIVKGLIKMYMIDSLKAKTIADMRLSGFSKASRESYHEEYIAKEKEINNLIKSLRDKDIKKSIIAELEEGIKLFGKPRRSKVIKDDGTHIVKKTNHVIVISRNGLIKKLPADIKDIGVIGEGDFPSTIFKSNNATTQLIFDAMGKVNKLNIFDVPNGVLSKPGNRITDYTNINGKIISIIPRPSEEALAKIKEPTHFILVTKKGIIKKMEARLFVNIQKGSTAIMLNKDDSLVDLCITVGNKDVLLYTRKGLCIRIPTDDITPIGRVGKGVKAMNLADDDELIGVDIIDKKDTHIMIITAKGMVKKTSIDSIPRMDRYKDPLNLIKLVGDDLIFKALPCVDKDVFRVVQPSGLTNISASSISEATRISKGKKTVPVSRGDDIVDFYKIERNGTT